MYIDRKYSKIKLTSKIIGTNWIRPIKSREIYLLPLFSLLNPPYLTIKLSTSSGVPCVSMLLLMRIYWTKRRQNGRQLEKRPPTRASAGWKCVFELIYHLATFYYFIMTWAGLWHDPLKNSSLIRHNELSESGHFASIFFTVCPTSLFFLVFVSVGRKIWANSARRL